MKMANFKNKLGTYWIKARLQINKWINQVKAWPQYRQIGVSLMALGILLIIIGILLY